VRATTEAPSPLVWGEPRARWVLAATVLGSALAFIDATVVNIALPRIGEDLEAETVGLTWVVNGYALTLAALVLLGGSLGDRLGRRAVFITGVVIFACASALCGLAPNVATLVAARAVQGVGAALLTPASLAILQASFSVDDRARAIGAWSGLTGVAAAVGPFVGGWLVQFADWRWVFLVNLPVAAAVVILALRHVPETRDPAAPGELDLSGTVLLAGALGGVTFGLTAMSSPRTGGSTVPLALVAGVVLGAAIIARKGAVEGRKTAVPFGPFLALGGIVAYFVGNELADAYLDTF
jgi:MFS family permease